MALTQVPIELSSTPGIVDNSNATAITIDSSENVGIGTSSPAVPLHVHADGTGLRLQGVSPDTNGAILDFYNSSGSRRGLVGFVGSGTTMMVSNDESGPLAFQTANTERMRLTATGLGIGTTSPYASLTVDTANGILNIANGNTSGGTKIQAWGATPSDGYLVIEGYTKEYMRLDLNGNLLVGNTIANPASGFSNQKGFGCTNSTGKVEIATTANDAAIEIGKNNANDGSLVVFRKQSTTVGSIGTVAGDIVIGTGACGIRFHDGTPALQPRNTDGSANNDAIDIGLTGNRFKDLYLSGVAYATGVEITGSGNRGVQITTANTGSGYINFGDPQDSNVGLIAYDHNVNALYMRTSGSERIRILSTGGITFNGDTAQANALNDYEEGTWTPTLTGGTSAGTTTYNGRSADYTKIGNTVRVGFYISFTAATGTGQLRLGGLPFTQNADNGNNVKLGGIMTDGLNWDVDGSLILMGTIDTTFMRVGLSRDDTAIHLQNVTNETATIWGSLTYITNS